MTPDLYIIEANELNTLPDDAWIIVDLSDAEAFAEGHIPGAINLPYAMIVQKRPPAMGDVPDVQVLEQRLGELGISEHSQIIAYDRDGGGKSGRFIWTLDWLGHQGIRRWLNGGLTAWVSEGKPLSTSTLQHPAQTYHANVQADLLISADDIEACLADTSVTVLDARTPEEFSGADVRAKHGGHIPGAVNQNWLDLKDASQQHRLYDKNTRKHQLETLNVNKNDKIIVHCHTHHRSGLSYVNLKSLGYPKVSGYAGSWSEWGNSDTRPKSP